MEKVKSRQKRKKERVRSYNLERQIPDAPTLEEFECLLGESPTNYPKVEGVENMESELHSAAIDMNNDSYTERQKLLTTEDNTEEFETQQSSVRMDEITVDQVDGKEDSAPVPATAPVIDENEGEELESVVSTISSIQLEKPMPSAPILETPVDQAVVEQSSESNDSVLPKQKVIKIESQSFRLDTRKKSEVVPFTDSQLAELYSNEELSWVETFVTYFIETELRNSALRQQHRLHELLMSYLRVRNNLIVNCHELESVKKNCKEIQKQLWCLDKAVITESGECQDGNPVSASHEYSIARFNQHALTGLTKSLASIKDLLHNSQALYSYEAELLRLQIDHYVQRVCTSCKEFATVAQNSPVNLTNVDSSVLPRANFEMDQLKTCITILFNFQRRVIRDGKFVLDSREWLSRLVAVLLRVANWQDHMFILNHVLRCPGGVTNWAIGFVQIPLPPRNCTTISSNSLLNDPYLDHMVATLAVILLPIREREKFLEQVHVTSLQETNSADNPSDTVWVMLDEEGEEDEDLANLGANLFESDLIALLHQIPLEKLFEHIPSREQDDLTESPCSFAQISPRKHRRILRLFAFSTVLVRLLKQGLKTYNSPRYRQLAKRLSAIIRDIVQYATDEWESYDKNEHSSMWSRQETEYDSFFLRATMCIFSSRRLGAWQYLATIPYHLISSSTLWHIFYILHTDVTSLDYLQLDLTPEDWDKELNKPQLRDAFEEKLSEMPGDESYFLLTTFANMAMARSNQDYDFIRATTIDLFQIGFLSTKTKDSCSKDARSLLTNLTSKHPALLSDIIVKLRDNFESVGKLSIYLFTELRIDKWTPKEEDMLVLSNWLHQHPLSSTENHLARLVLTHLNWGMQRDKPRRDDLYLPAYFHCRVAILIVELALKYIPDNPTQTASLISESVKQVSSMVRPQSNEHAFAIWAWEMMSKLRLHRLDQSESVCHKGITNPAEAFSNVPDLDSDASLESVMTGVRDKQPIACFVAATMTLWGHSIPLICTKGFEQLTVLLLHYKYDHVLMALCHIVPLFLSCPESLLTNDKFSAIILSLVTADRTYMKMAKNLIAPDLPGPVLKQFANMIESHIVGYKRYVLPSPAALVRLWLDIFVSVPDWNRDPNVLHLIDTVIRGSFFHLDARAMVEDVFQNLFTNLGTGRGTGSFGSFISWATGAANTASLLGGPVQSIWVAYQVLRTEQTERELKNGLWRQLLRELSTQTKISLDTALKKACAHVKVPSFGTNGLSIYRWSQQALDTPMDHPLLPLLWQHFFSLFLARAPTIPGVAERGGLGDKFFDGMLNLSYLKKVKKRLHDTVTYFQVKGEKDTDTDGKPITDERRVFYFNAAKLYKTLSLWLEEPRLQESGLYLPALPPQYMSQKLLMLMQGDEDPWLEYVDYWSVQQSQLKCARNWQNLCCRKSITVEKWSEEERSEGDKDDNINDNKEWQQERIINKPIGKIHRRLSSYERPKEAPSLAKNMTPLENVPRECLYEPENVMNLLKPHLKIIMDYAQTYNLLISEHTAVDCTFLELVPTLYREVENCVTLHALCDPAPSSGPRRSRSGTPPTVHCAGPAVIRIKITEARVSDAVDQMISQNRGIYENLLVKATQPPPSRVTQGCAFADHLVALLEYELNVNRTCESSVVLRKVQESGVKLFHHLVEFYTEEAALCPPTKQLITTCIEKLGQAFISGEESQGPPLLRSIIQRPNLGGILGPHFTPVAGGATTFLQMYQTVVDLSTGTNADLCFVLLSKFDVGSWLNYRRPRLSERSTFIDLVSRALCNIGLNPEDSKLILHELFRNHLRLVLLHEFPEHYGEVLGAVLRGSEGQSLSLDVWRDLLGALSGRSKSAAPIQPNKVRDEIRRYATEQKLLSRQEMHDTAVLLSQHFMKERLQYGLYGLYPKYRIYNEPLVMFLGMVGHALVVLTLQCDRGSLADQLCEQIWPVLSEMFAPWMTPYWTRNLREPTAAWIQQLTDDRSVLLPWIITDGPCANRTVAMFVECIRFIVDTLPASSKILCFLWQFYVTNFAHASVKDHILNVVHGNFMSLPWDKFNPGIGDVELMVKVVDQYLPDSHLFLGSVFVAIDWTAWINQLMASQPLSIAARMHVCLLNLIVKLSNEPNVRQNDRAVESIIEAEKFAWHLVDATAYDQVINWHVMSCDPRVVLSCCSEQAHPIDVAVNNLLKVVAAYDPTVTHFHPTTLKKRQMYVRSWVKLLINCTTRHKALLSNNTKAFTNALSRILDDMEIVLTSTVSEGQQAQEAGLLISELLHAVNASTFLVEQLRISWVDWLSEKTASSSPVLLGILRVVGIAAISPATLGQLLEAALEAFFKHSVTDQVEPTWTSVLGIIQPIVPRQPPVEGVLVSEGRLLALYALLLKRLPSCRDIREEGMLLVNLVDWIAAIKPMDSIEEKLPLLWAKTFELVYRQCQYSENTVIAARSLKKFARALLTIADDAGQGWGILGAIGLRKASPLTSKCRFLCRVLGVYALAQLPESKSEQQLIRFTPHSPGVAPARTNDSDVMEVRPSLEAIKGMQTLEALVNNKQYAELKTDVEQAIRTIKDSGNSLHNAIAITGLLATELYTRRYLHLLVDH
ncbi:ectopic P granules protein 5 homolog isoform X2 [Venturia canescens]|uniref:ectopic P granules protein 5 homolog isoform X2 n=1 Tax=Venturia canescens TaxID=32260 RepID=UPI001C9D63F2|nr:ectopic P granules protein 5 homolog isoform X2 [Venturia canescens]